ncbi:cell wall protein DAN4-like [Cyprinodon tularosa]|uniref:cell wall protein DAN4-like n=1 Tax=Cyprinodon tularosa TaxID=77115 RepID=UPI0018E27ADE|nr:cell wall protein DAN4-like [Cyprinodon tularosa]
MSNTEAEMGLEFNETTPMQNLPDDEAVKNTLIEAINSTTFNVSFVADSVNVTRTPLPSTTATTNTTTAAPNKTTAAPTTTSAPTTTTAAPTKTSAPTTTTAATTTTTAAPTTTTATTVEATVTKRLTFRSAGETFTNDLLDSSSAAFRNRAQLLKSNLEPVYRRSFSSFRNLFVISFSNGSIINNIDLRFAAASAPNGTRISEVLVNAASNITDFNIDTSSIFVDGTQVSSGVNHNMSLITALCMVLLSWLLSSQQ